MKRPSTKWLVTQVTAISAWLIALIENDMHFSSTLAIAAIGIGSQAVIGYLVPNSVADVEEQNLRGGSVVVARTPS